MANLSDYAENLLLKWMFTANAATRPTAWYLALFTAAPSDAGGGTEVSGSGYARQAITPSVTGNAMTNDNAQAFTAAGGNFGDVVAIGVFDALTTGNLLSWGFNQAAPKGFSATTADVFTSPAHGYADGDRVVFYDGGAGALPTGISAGTIYFVRDSATDTFKVAATAGGTAIDLTVAGVGLVAKVNVKTINDGDQFNMAAGELDLLLH